MTLILDYLISWLILAIVMGIGLGKSIHIANEREGITAESEPDPLIEWKEARQ